MKTIPTALIAPLFNPATFAERGKADSLLAEVRRDYPLARAEVPGYDPHWIVSRHADIQEVSRQNDLFHNADRSATVIPQMGEALVQPADGTAEQVARVFEVPDRKANTRIWPALLRMLDRIDPGYKN